MSVAEVASGKANMAGVVAPPPRLVEAVVAVKVVLFVVAGAMAAPLVTVLEAPSSRLGRPVVTAAVAVRVAPAPGYVEATGRHLVATGRQPGGYGAPAGSSYPRAGEAQELLWV